ncbi:NAD(P)H-hydrate dehydratase [Halpernia sp.]|uniref:NAD(P)H-hydrate dehydratase n=1 Tax=Halpernia sp. TaxID=2782209 RepID=UPI003A92C1E2
MKIFDSIQIKKLETETIFLQNISSIQLMERAAEEVMFQLLKNSKPGKTYCIFCGNGNNGGDGFALARMLYEKNFNVEVFVDKECDKYSENAQINLDKIEQISGIGIHDFSNLEQFNFQSDFVIIDALFGIGLNREIKGKSSELILKLNSLKNFKIAIDIPSGLFADKITPENFTVFKANKTLSFQFWKKAFLYPETGKYCGKIEILKIGISTDLIERETTNCFIIDDNLIKSINKKRDDFSNKGNFGNSVIIAGSYGKMGAAVLAIKAALRSGNGLTFTIAPKCGYEILQSSAPEAMFIQGGKNLISEINLPKNVVCGIGPGLGTEVETEKAVLEFLKTYKKALVIDADALNIISKNKNFLNIIPENSVITPHPKEFERLFGSTENSFELTNLALKMAKKFKIIIVLKDHHTQIITPKQKIFYNITGNSGMAKGGSGDVLTGIITSLLSQNYLSQNAAIFGVWLHGKAGDFAAEEFSKNAMLPSDLINSIGKVFKYLQV